jgi:2,4-dienoyl-CoA reductase-like NADH-dependent reductase (Old Yellow Enzyme family)
MTEGLADAEDRATKRHQTLYRRWSEGGAGLLITGNVMVDRRYLERPGNVVFDSNGGMEELRSWVAAGTRGGSRLWMQISHPGRQCTRMSSSHPVSASSVQMRGMLGLMAAPRALEGSEIRNIIRRFAHVANGAKEAGFDGVQVHSAHGYLCSQFLSPRTNQRTDEWGGSLENRARLLREIAAAVREAVGPEFPIGVKLNSADFQKGGFTNEESAQVARWLSDLGVDLLEISGGNYEQMAVIGRLDREEQRKRESTRRREAYFLEYARLIREAAPGLPLMVTGGFRSVPPMRAAVESGEVDVVGIARPFCVMPDAPLQALNGKVDTLPSPERQIRLGPGILSSTSPFHGVRTLNGQSELAWFYHQIIELSEGREPDLMLGTWPALMAHFRRELGVARRRTFKRAAGALPASTETEA